MRTGLLQCLANLFIYENDILGNTEIQFEQNSIVYV